MAVKIDNDEPNPFEGFEDAPAKTKPSSPVAPSALEALRTPAQAAPRPETPYVPGDPLTLTPSTPKPSRARERAALAYRATLSRDDAVIVDVAPGDPIPIIDPLRVAELAATCSEVRLATADLGDVFLVAKRTDRHRTELTFDDAALLTTIVATFPGSRLIGIRSPRDQSAHGNPENKHSDAHGGPLDASTDGGPNRTDWPPETNPKRTQSEHAANPVAIGAAEAAVKQSAVDSRLGLKVMCWGCDLREVAEPGALCENCDDKIETPPSDDEEWAR
jgi:hypothetical protein